MTDTPHDDTGARRSTSVSFADVFNDLDDLGTNTWSGEYGYFRQDGHLYVEVWNDDYHGVKAYYRVDVELTPVPSSEVQS